MYTYRSVKANHKSKLKIQMGYLQDTKSRRELELLYQPQRLTLQATSCHFKTNVCPDKSKRNFFPEGSEEGLKRGDEESATKS